MLSNSASRLYLGQAVVAILAFCGLLYGFGYFNIEPRFYLNRDDALICYSHAVNLVDFGFSGVNPSGERLEAYSTPLLFLAYWAYYGLTHGGFEVYVILQSVVCTILMAWFIFRASPVDGWRAIAVTAGVGFLLSQHTRWLQWHASGMENALTEVAMLATLAAIVRGLGGKPSLWHALAFGLLGIARVEFLFFSVPLGLLYLLMQNKQGDWRRAWASVGAGWLITASIHIIRIVYYGTFQPNTSWAQGLDLAQQFKLIAGHDPWYISKTNVVVSELLLFNGAYLGVFAMGLVAYFGSQKHRNLGLLVMVVLCLTIAHGVLFAATRLDPMRYGTQLAPLCMLLLAGVVLSITKTSTYAFGGMALATVPVVWLFTRTPSAGAQDVCCNYESFAPISDSVTAIGRQNNIAMPTLANPDLGIVSYRKTINVIDMANIGTSALARMSYAEPFKKHYLFYYAAPDLVEMHGSWVEAQRAYLGDYRFSQLYDARWTSPNGAYPPLPNGFWVRKDVLAASPSAERAWMTVFSEAMLRQAAPAKLVRLVEQELAKPASGAPRLAKTYVARTIYRHLPEIRVRQGMLPALISALRASPTYAYDSLLLTSAQVRDYGGKVSQLLGQSLMREVFDTNIPLSLEASAVAYLTPECKIGEAFGWQAYYKPGAMLLYAERQASAYNNRWVRLRFWLTGRPDFVDITIEPLIQRLKYKQSSLVLSEIPAEPLDSLEISSENGNQKGTWTIKMRAPK